MKFTLNSQPLAGFADETAEPGKTLRIITAASTTSDKRIFHVWMKHITASFLVPTGIYIESIHAFLVVLHQDYSADVYINDFDERAEIKVNRDIKAGAPVLVEDISDISRVTFPGIDISRTDAIVYGRRNLWRFSLYFDFRRAIDTDELSLDLGKLKKEATFYALIAAADAQVDNDSAAAFVFAEGKTDWKHLLAAVTRIGLPFVVSFAEDGFGAADLLRMCEYSSRVPHPKPIIFVFDRDDKNTMNELRKRDVDGRAHQDWGNNVFSLYLPVPLDRTDDTHSISIEFFYPDADIVKPDQSGRRLYLSSEFDRTTGADGSGKIVCRDQNVLKRHTICIVDHDVYKISSKESVALSKDRFATAIYNAEPPFDSVDHTAFVAILDIISGIIDP